jgi:hypothetical protein
MSSSGDGSAPVGVRPVVRETGMPASRLRWVRGGSLDLAFGDRVAVVEDDDEWLAEVVVPAGRLIEWPAHAELPLVRRLVSEPEWPSLPATDGRRLLESLALPPKPCAEPGPGEV